MIKQRSLVVAAAVALSAAAACAVTVADAALALPAVSSPGAVTVGCPFRPGSTDTRNSGYLDTNAFYGVGQIPLSLPAGVSIRIQGRFPKTRYFSLQSYDGAKAGNYVDSEPDAVIVPTTGAAVNPDPAALPDSAGYTNQYVLTLSYSDPPANPADRTPNTLYVGAPQTTGPNRVSKQLIYRTYLANPGSTLQGDVPMPDLIYSGPSGDINFNDTPDQTKCSNINTLAGSSTTLNVGVAPARKIAFTPASHTKDTVPYPNGDANYLRASSAKLYSPIVVFRAKQFNVPVLPDQPPSGVDADIRYWSFCSYNLSSGAAVACLSDRDWIVQPDGYGVIVVSPAANRPMTATTANGYNWMDAGTNKEEELVLRQLLARPGFSGDYGLAAAQPNLDLGTSLGVWAPQITYCDAATFDAYSASGGAALFDACNTSFYKPLLSGSAIAALLGF